MAFLLLSISLLIATFAVVRPALIEGPRITLTHFDGKGVLIAVVFVIGATMVLGAGLAAALLLALMVKDLGHVIGRRLAGHADTKLRLLPLPGGPAICDRAPRSDLEAFFILLMGPGLGFAPMATAFANATAFAAHFSTLGAFLLGGWWVHRLLPPGF
ncbi:hypothetical protein [Sinisalibacter lacisalsi]|uniref:Uncharacterized protein n=1 Tax=Sinisalibacter lacisalsi TaxID=1526570 RepID=A0ABQ1QQ56_9RHOB|nr:hypothetical protein [Sinisalibacter lacisalsi]GGD38070.1 hypothetical protein GCM10011358_22300 [Sinisalibacter lacisalsi]